MWLSLQTVHGFHQTIVAGAFAVVCLECLAWAVYHVPIPCRVRHSYAVEVYILGVLFHVKSIVFDTTRVSCASADNLWEGGDFINSKWCIMALQSCRPDDLGRGLAHLLLAEYFRMARCFPPPEHLYPHQEGTFLDTLLDAVDSVAKTQALHQPLSYIGSLQPSQPCFKKDLGCAKLPRK